MATLLLHWAALLIRSLRLIIGTGLIGLGILGVVLPVLPGMPFLILGILTIGRRQRVFRQGSVAGKRLLKRWTAHHHPRVARIGRWSLAAQRKTSRQLRRMLWRWQRLQQTVQGRLRLTIDR